MKRSSPRADSRSYNTPYSKQCFILPSGNNDAFFETLERWGVKDKERIKGSVIDVDRRDR